MADDDQIPVPDPTSDVSPRCAMDDPIELTSSDSKLVGEVALPFSGCCAMSDGPDLIRGEFGEPLVLAARGSLGMHVVAVPLTGSRTALRHSIGGVVLIRAFPQVSVARSLDPVEDVDALTVVANTCRRVAAMQSKHSGQERAAKPLCKRIAMRLQSSKGSIQAVADVVLPVTVVTDCSGPQPAAVRVGTIDVALKQLVGGSTFPCWHRRLQSFGVRSRGVHSIPAPSVYMSGFRR